MVVETLQAKVNEDACWEAVAQRRAASDGYFVVAVRTTKNSTVARPVPRAHPGRERRLLRHPRPGGGRGLPRLASAAGRAKASLRRRSRARDLRRHRRRDLRIRPRSPTGARASERAPFTCSACSSARPASRRNSTPPRAAPNARKIALRGQRGVTTAIDEAGYARRADSTERSNGRLGMTPGELPAPRRRYGHRLHHHLVRLRPGPGRRHGTRRCCWRSSLPPMLTSNWSCSTSTPPRRSAATTHRCACTSTPSSAASPPARRGAAPAVHPRDRLPHPRVRGAAQSLGVTRSYSDIARQIGNPKAVRAVGTACAENPEPSPSPYPATASCARTARSAATATASTKRATRPRARRCAKTARKREPAASIAR